MARSPMTFRHLLPLDSAHFTTDRDWSKPFHVYNFHGQSTAHTHTHKQTVGHTDAQTHRRTHGCSLTRAHARMHARVRAHAHTQIQARAGALGYIDFGCAHAHTHVHVCTRICKMVELLISVGSISFSELIKPLSSYELLSHHSISPFFCWPLCERIDNAAYSRRSSTLPLACAGRAGSCRHTAMAE